ncbi:alpha-tocopherol transfer protein-like [Photinus pyralis]|uniref:alpha-tocopherol transfer protein-like n=1 Tax=Photinus pyralis TaxID=7054 RepID=UPI0012672671|nr:alpha-tocopherol transfer protein-like [Photinus pyralis]
MKVFFMTLEILLMEDDDFVISGITGVVDHNECPVSYYLQFTPVLMKNFLQCIQNAYPLRVKGCAVFNTLTVFETIFNTFIKPFLGSKLRKRVTVPNKEQSKEFLSKFPRSLLPTEYGGTNGSMDDAVEQWKKKVESYRQWFLDDAKYGTNEKLRVDKSKTIEDGVITDGTFRNLVFPSTNFMTLKSLPFLSLNIYVVK